MATLVNEHLILIRDGDMPDIEMYLNDSGEIFVSEVSDNPYSSFFTISEDDWVAIKKFINKQFGIDG